MVELHFYGKLMRYSPERNADFENIIKVKPGDGDTIESVLEGAGVPVHEIFHIFFNRKLLSTRNTMADSLGYMQARDNPFDWDLKVPVRDGDRIGIFGRDMSALVV